MLSYAYQTLRFSEYKNIGVESFANVKELYSEILVRGLPVLIRGGLLKEYIRVSERDTVIRGKVDINSSIKKNSIVNKKLIAIHDDFSEDVLLNQILKATLIYFSRSSMIDRARRHRFQGFLPYFSSVSDIELNIGLWKKVQYNRKNIRYQFLIDICRFLYEEVLISDGDLVNHQSIEDEQKLSSLFEKFVFAFYKRNTEYKVIRPQISWNVDNGFIDALPIMQTDIVLQCKTKTLIIDTKFYSENMAKKFEGGALKQKSGNLYQIFTYVNNWQTGEGERVGGMLLYAKTISEEQPNHHYEMNGKSIWVMSIELNQDFNGIYEDLIKYANDFFDVPNSTC